MAMSLRRILNDYRDIALSTFLDRPFVLHNPGNPSQVAFWVGWTEEDRPFPHQFMTPERISADLVSGITYPGPHWGYFTLIPIYMPQRFVGLAIVFIPATRVTLMGPYNFGRHPAHFYP